MTDELIVVEGYVRDHFVIEGKLFSTPFANAHKGIDRFSHSPVLLWLTKYSFTHAGGETQRFCRRMEGIKRLNLRSSMILSYGVDSTGMGFVAMPALDGFPLYAEPLDVVEGERRFAACVDLVQKIHAENFVIGDISPGSFWVARNGQVSLIGVLGLPERWEERIDEELASFAVRFMAPEVKDGSAPSAASDVFSLGVLGYVLMTNQHPMDEENDARGVHIVRPMRRILADAPAWTDQTLMKCLEYDPGDRFQNASEMREGILEAKHSTFLSSLAPIRYGADMMTSGTDRRETVLTTGPIMTNTMTHEAEDAGKEKASRYSRKVFLLAGLGGSAAMLLCVLAWLLLMKPVAGPESSGYGDVEGSERVRQAIDMIGNSSEESEKQEAKYFQDLAESADPLAQDMLVRSAVNPSSNVTRALAEEAIKKRMQRLGFKNTEQALSRWLASLKTGALPAAYEPFLRAADPTLPIEARLAFLQRAAESDKEALIDMISAVVIDTRAEGAEAYKQLLISSIRQARNLDVDAGLSILGVICIPTDTAARYGAQIFARLPELSDKDLYSLLDAFVLRKDERSSSLANEIVRRNLVSPVRAIFLSAINFQSGTVSNASQLALAHAAEGTLKEDDFAALGAWYAPTSEKVLLALVADLADPATSLKVFDILAARSLTTEPAATLIPWIRNNRWEQRSRYARLVSLLGVSDVLPTGTDDEIEGLIRANVDDGKFVEVFLGCAPPRFLQFILDNYPAKVPLNVSFDLLLHSDKNIRMKVLPLLQSVNDLKAMKLLLERYEAETDPDVRNKYKDTFWFIRQRKDI